MWPWKGDSSSGTRAKGTLKKWFEDKGYGFIAPANGSKDVFVHISAFGRGLPRSPKVGDNIFYHVAKDDKGKTKAFDVTIEGVAPIERRKTCNHYPSSGRKTKGSWTFLVICTALIIGAGSMVYNRVQSAQPSPCTCSGKTHCSQMTSCEEAKFYIRNCPNTEMDGVNDGIPCEKQWCN